MHALEGVSLGLYGLVGVGCVVSVVVTRMERDVARYRTQQCFHLFLASFVIVRLLWFGLLSADVPKSVTFVLNRLGFSLYFTAFTLVLFFWVENYHKTYISTHEFLPRFFWAFVGCNSLMYVYETIIVILFLALSNGKEEGNAIYDLSIYTIIALSFAVSITFLIYGIRLYVRHKFAKDFEENHSERTSELVKIFFCTVLFCACFIARGGAFLYRPVTNKYLKEEVFWTLAYYIPELIPSVVEFYVIRALKQQSREQEVFIEALYQEEESLQREEGHLTPPLALSTFKSSPPSPRFTPSPLSLSPSPSSSSVISTPTPTGANEKSPLMGPQSFTTRS